MVEICRDSMEKVEVVVAEGVDAGDVLSDGELVSWKWPNLSKHVTPAHVSITYRQLLLLQLQEKKCYTHVMLWV